MGIEQFEIVLIASCVAVACALPGVFLVLRKVALMSDAISHAILLGIVVAFFAIKNLHSPLLIISAALTGVLTVTLTEMIINSRRLKKDAAIGLVFPVFFSIGVILINLYAGDVHLDQDAVLLGEIAFAPFNRFIFQGVDLGPIALWVMGIIMIINIVFIILFYKELKLATFDSALAATLGFTPVWIHYGLMTVVSVTAVGAFDAVGSILVVALMITPPATAYLLTQKLVNMLFISAGVGIISAVLGFLCATIFDASIAGFMATITGVLFLLALIFSPNQGLLMKYLLAKKQKLSFSTSMLLVQLLDHEGTEHEEYENSFNNMISHMGWTKKFASQVAQFSVHKGYITRKNDLLILTSLGREQARYNLIYK